MTYEQMNEIRNALYRELHSGPGPDFVCKIEKKRYLKIRISYWQGWSIDCETGRSQNFSEKPFPLEFVHIKDKYFNMVKSMVAQTSSQDDSTGQR